MTYKDSGVDIAAGDALVERIKPLARSTDRAGTMGGLGGFGALFDLRAAGFRDPVLVSTTDGVGTKLKLAIEAGCHDTVGIDLVAMCVNDLVVQGAEPLFFLDYFATGALDVSHAAAVVAGIAEGCRQAGCALVGGETAEMPSLYAGGDYDLAGFGVGAAERDALLPRNVAPGQTVLALPSSGVHSNGFSLVRRIAAARGLGWEARRGRLEAFAKRLPAERFDVSQLIEGKSFDDLMELRMGARDAAIEGLMLKRRDSPYVTGRRAGLWYKWKRDPLTADCVMMYAQRGHGKRSSFYSDYTFGCWTDDGELLPVGKAYSGFTDAELAMLDRFVRNHTVKRFGPVREVEKTLVLEVAFDSLHLSGRHKSGVAMRFPRVSRIRTDKPASEADTIAGLKKLVT